MDLGDLRRETPWLTTARLLTLHVLVRSVVFLVPLALAARAGAAVTLTASRPDLLYTAEANPDCSKLCTKGDADLPFNIVRLRAVVDGVPPDQVGYQWIAPKPQVGTLAADLDLGPTEQTAALRALCAEFGNACVLTPDKLRFYNQPTILWLAPTCDILPDKTSKQYRGGLVRFGVKAAAGKRKLGKATTSVAYGRIASVTLYASDARNVGQDGIGRPDIPSDIDVLFGAIVNAPSGALPGSPATFKFQTVGSSKSVPPEPCADQGNPGLAYDACAPFAYKNGGRSLASVQVDFADRSALCDNVTVRILTSQNEAALSVTASPRRRTYVSGDTVNVRVTFKNVSSRENARGAISLRGAGVLTCAEEIKLGKSVDTKTTTFDLQHCSETTEQPCFTDEDCGCPSQSDCPCDKCKPNEMCLNRSHCSESISRQGCTHDSDCEKPACPDCKDGESCVRVLEVPQIGVPIGQSIDLVNMDVPLVNVFPDTARVTDTWTVNPFNAGPADDTLKYRIRGRPGASPESRQCHVP